MQMEEFKIIQELMDRLKDEMQYGPDDLEGRLGRKKPEVQVVKMEGELPMGDGRDMNDMEEGSSEDEDMPSSPYDKRDDMEEGDDSPEGMFKKRLMKLRA